MKKLPVFTNIMTNMEDYKNQKFSLKWPERVQAFKIWINYNKKPKDRLTQMMIKSPNYAFKV